MQAKTELDKMLSGEYYDCMDPVLVKGRQIIEEKYRDYNSSNKANLAESLVSKLPDSSSIRVPVYFDYGYNTTLGENSHLDSNCNLLDCNRVTIGSNTYIGEGVHVYPATHPIDPKERASGAEFALKVSIGSNVFIGGGAVLCPGVSIGDDCVVECGTVVSKDIPKGARAYGNPCKVELR